ncbi:hypothetical protein [Pseudobacteriovorax antillogorgiicola]|uniref:Uncharacterized protein n=1 Tax=Pseudobacteriovorax antillogorgiicola TaxID=1513793 RepID=A0A1Y6CL08_9BACT|nr:hypothetical protein [Pseudobacteriovorax antillogorgiicola]TCS45677.1 hypothetical protein EDD56_12771 [Pseudobacteriovorax antillogorgiicola]SMF73137.1 hypothetical protein SAMN06296036_12770 [Pseudobacteriovorax antillogorgiicola]
MLVKGTIILGLMFASSAFATSRGTVTNCTNQRVNVCVYNGKDSVRAFAAQDFQLGAGESKNFRCKGENKGRCKIQFIPRSQSVCGELSPRTYNVKRRQNLHLTAYNESSLESTASVANSCP